MMYFPVANSPVLMHNLSSDTSCDPALHLTYIIVIITKSFYCVCPSFLCAQCLLPPECSCHAYSRFATRYQQFSSVAARGVVRDGNMRWILSHRCQRSRVNSLEQGRERGYSRCTFAILHVRKPHAMKQKMNRDVGMGECTKEQRSMVDFWQYSGNAGMVSWHATKNR